MSEFFTSLFGGDYVPPGLSVGQAIARAFLVYGSGIIIARVGNARLLGRGTVLDILLAFMMGSVLSRAVNGSGSISGSLAATATMVATHWTLTFIGTHHHPFGRWVKGPAVEIIRDGKCFESSLTRAHLSPHDVEEALRLNANIDDLSKVKSAYLERNGEIGIVRKD